MRRLFDWLDHRTGYRAVIHHALDEQVRGGPSWAYVFGSVLTFLFTMQAVTGVLLALYYSPSATDAWSSVAFIQDQVTLGWFIRGLHSYGASAMVIVLGLHLLQVAVYGAYRAPREVTWLLGVAMMGLVLAFALTGYLLPWDQKGYWATKVATGIMGSTPVLGEWLQRVVQGGNEYGNLTLTRFFTLHTFVLPALLVGLVVLHIALFRRHGVTPKWGRSEAELARTTAPFAPRQLFRDLVVMAITFAAVAGTTLATGGAELGAPADPASGYDARPEWYFLPLFQLLKYFHGPMEQVVALGLPAVVFGVLAALPFLDRGPSTSPRARWPFVGVILIGLVGGGALTALARRDDASDERFQAAQKEAHLQAQKARQLARLGVPPAGGVAVYENEPFFHAKRIWRERCTACHVGEGAQRKGPLLGPGYNSRAWIKAFLQAPNAPEFFGTTKIQKMPPAKETGADLDAMVEFVYAQTGASDANGALVAKGQALFDDGDCSNCHSADWETVDDEGPNLGRRGTAEYLSAFLRDPGHDRFFGALNEMPAQAGELSDREIDDLAAWIATWKDLPAD